MSVHSTLSKAGPFIADGSQTEFPFRFSVIDLDHIAVYRNGVAVPSGEYETYAMGTGPVDESDLPEEGEELTGDMSRGGYILFAEPPPSGAKIVILRKVPLTQETDIQNNTAFNPEILEDAYDKLTMIAQQLSEEIDRSIKVGVGETDVNPDALLAGVYEAADASQRAAEAAQQKANEAADAAAFAGAAAEEANRAKESAAGSVEAVREAADEAVEKFDEMLEKTVGLPLGSIFLSPSGAPPEGAYLLNGQEIKQCHTLYPKFYEWLMGQVKHSETSGSPLVNLFSRFKPWTMPSLTADGAVGSLSYAVEASGACQSGYEAYKSFDGTHGGLKSYALVPGTQVASLTWYSPVKIYVSRVMFQNPTTGSAVNLPSAVVVECSNDGSSWEELASAVYESQSASATQTVELGKTRKYFRFTATNNGGSSVEFPEITLYGEEFLYTDAFYAPVSEASALIAAEEETYERILQEHGACGAFFVDSFSHKVRLPDWRNAYPLYTGISRVSSLSTPGYPGDTIPAGLPNITGETGISNSKGVPYDAPLSGSFTFGSSIGSKKVAGDSSNSYSSYLLGFDASLSNPIYGNSDTVRPLSISAAWCIQVYKAATALSEQESAQLASLMQTKAQTDFGNVGTPVQSFIDKSVAWGLPDYSAGIAVSHPTSDTPFTAPCAGVFFECFYYGSETASTLHINYNASGIIVKTGATYRDNRQSTPVYLNKGDVIYWSTPATSVYAIAFYPLKGVEK